MIKNDEKQSKTMKNVEKKQWKTTENKENWKEKKNDKKDEICTFVVN